MHVLEKEYVKMFCVLLFGASWRLGLSLEGRFGGLHEERYFPLRKIRELFGSFAYVNLNKKHP